MYYIGNKAIYADLHTHTIGSLHAFSTLHENMKAAKKRLIGYIAVTDHFYYHPDDLCQRLNELGRITNTEYMPKDPNITVIQGIEANLNHKVDDFAYDKSRTVPDCNIINKACKWRLVGMHDWFLKQKDCRLDLMPQFFEDTITNHNMIHPTAFAHIERTISVCSDKNDTAKVRSTLQDIVNIAVENDIFLEINNASVKNNFELMKMWINYAKEKNAKFCLGTDAHNYEMVGNFSQIEELCSVIDMSNAYILNCDANALSQYEHES